MAKPAKTTKKATGKDLTVWDKELAEQANMAAGQVATSLGGGGFFSIEGGILSFGGNELPDGQMACIVVDAVRVNTWFDRPYKRGDNRAPSCWAIARTEPELEPHKDAELPQHEGACDDCPLGGKEAFGSAAQGKGKACRNGWRLAVIPAGDLDKGGNLEDLTMYEPEYIEKSPLTWFNVPPTSSTAFAQYVDGLKNAFKRPPHMFVTRIRVKGDKETQVKVDFHALLDIRLKASDLVPMLMDRHKKANKEIMFGYPQNDDAADTKRETAKRRSGQAAGREPVSRGNGARKPVAAPPKGRQGGARAAGATKAPARGRAAPAAAQAAPTGRRKFTRD